MPATPMSGDPALELSDLIGLEAEEARRRLEAAGHRVGGIAETAPPRPAALAGPARVVRVRRGSDGRVDLVVTRERFIPAAQS